MGVDVTRQWQRDESGQWIIPDIQAEFMDWEMLPRSSRVPGTQREWAKLHGVALDTVKKWRQDPRYREEWERRNSEYQADPSRTAAVVDVLHNAAVTLGDVQAARQYLSYVEKISPPRQVKRDRSVEHLSDAELEAEMRAMLEIGL